MNYFIISDFSHEISYNFIGINCRKLIFVYEFEENNHSFHYTKSVYCVCFSAVKFELFKIAPQLFYKENEKVCQPVYGEMNIKSDDSLSLSFQCFFFF